MIVNFFKNHWLLSSIILFVLTIIFGFFYVKYSFKLLGHFNRKNLEYSLVQLKDSVAGKVDSVYSSHGCAFVRLKDSSKIWFEVTANNNYKKNLLSAFIEVNDSLFKKPNNDTLFIIRNQKSFEFKLGELNQRKITK